MQRIQRIFNHDKFAYYLKRIKTLEKGRPFCLHPLEHSIDVARIAYILWLEQSLKEGGFSVSTNSTMDLTVDSEQALDAMKCYIYAAALLHDIGRYRQYLYGEEHAEVSANLAQEILVDTGFAEEEQAVILDAIRYHNAETSEYLLTRILQKADKLSRKCFQCTEQERCYKLSKMETRHGLIY
ncbi:HD domain-containing protein [Desulfuribacillus alkaliarsenatis]|uniref:HD domain-containing protein n=1 Tax=Desulfuribacillus alkaliarsenatis TaxID=766136 RepID=A0A1E5FYY8_9FIRM|nr:HD domain-containing protein [Desulfuribacillus alkaliarsenatis]OEF95795.1 hypothetical protein BHF68_11915 [Desulfuribacillus alkaliarsenatis]